MLAEVGTKVLFNVTSSTRDHITSVLTVNAAGEIAPPRIFFRGVRNVAVNHLAGLPEDGKSGAWGLSCTPKGFITRETFVLILQDLVTYLEKHKIPRPIILFMDGAAPHISLAMAEYCLAHQIQPWLLKPNTTHLVQPLDLTVMKSLKDILKRKVTGWQQRNTTSLSKYTVVPLLRCSVEELLTRPKVISSGFRRAGLVPWDPSAIDQSKMAPSSIFAVPAHQDSVVESGSSNLAQNSFTSLQLQVLDSQGLSPSARKDSEDWRLEKQQGHDTEQHVDLPKFLPRNLTVFETVFFTKEQVKRCEEMFLNKVKSSSPLYLAWKCLRKASLPPDMEAVEAVLTTH